MRAFLYQQSNPKPFRRIQRNELPACFLFFLLYAFGVSCGIACCDDGYPVRMLPPLSDVLANGTGWGLFCRSVLFCISAVLMHVSFVLLAGLSVWLLPLWAGAVLARGIAVGLCAALCLATLSSGTSSAVLQVSAAAAAFLIPFLSEIRLGILPLVRRTEPDMSDAEYLAVGVRIAMQFFLLSLIAVTAALLVLHGASFA